MGGDGVARSFRSCVQQLHTSIDNDMFGHCVFGFQMVNYLRKGDVWMDTKNITQNVNSPFLFFVYQVKSFHLLFFVYQVKSFHHIVYHMVSRKTTGVPELLVNSWYLVRLLVYRSCWLTRTRNMYVD